MGRLDRRQRLALDESYRYYRALEDGAVPDQFKLMHALQTLSAALSFADCGDFKLTRQLWKRLQQVLFDKLIIGFSGRFSVYRADGSLVPFGEPMPDDGLVGFHPDGCKRLEDAVYMEIARLYPQVSSVLLRTWAGGDNILTPAAFADGAECSNGICMMKPLLLGMEVLNEESSRAKEEAYYRWWDLYWQAYCIPSKQERSHIYRHMMQLEAVWGDLYW